jgi:lysozyme family protein
MDWEEIIADILESEGGLTKDHAGWTNRGISERGSGFSEEKIKSLTLEETIEWYTKEFYNRLKVLPLRLHHIACDYAVMSGVRQAIRSLQKAANYFHAAGIDEDGYLGPNTLRAVANVKPGEYRQFRYDFFKSLVDKDPEKYGKFANGWYKRVMRV